MPENKDVDAFDPEFRHNAVRKFIEDILNGSIGFARGVGQKEQKSMSVMAHRIKDNMIEYVSGRVESLDKIESSIFDDILKLRLSGLIIEKYEKSKVEKDIENLHKKIDATNELLETIALVLNELVKGLKK